MGTLIHTVFAEASGKHKEHLEVLRGMSQKQELRIRWRRALHDRLWGVFSGVKWGLIAVAVMAAGEWAIPHFTSMVMSLVLSALHSAQAFGAN